MNALYAALGTLFVGTVTGLWFLAARYPKTYMAVYQWICNVALIILGSLAAFSVGVGAGSDAVLPFVAPDKARDALMARDAWMPRVWMFLAILAILVIILILYLVSERLRSEKKEIEDAERDRE
ncbi:MAG TPA: hypothetical protein VEX35_01505 [Allosphingosinicella sp.]|nr:hypothetical protein [Allosphingosinicella sp.]